MDKIYYIYHIPTFVRKDGNLGKIGTSVNPKRRTAQQGYTEYEILETHTDIIVASKREIELQKQYGYVVDTALYFDSIKKYKKENVVKAGKASALKSWKENRERELQKCSKGGKVIAEKTGKPVTMCDMQGNILKTFKNRTEAVEYVNGNKPPLIVVIDKPNLSYKGYRWITPPTAT